MVGHGRGETIPPGLGAHTRIAIADVAYQHLQGFNSTTTQFGMADKPTTKKFAKGERSIPHHSQKASKYYPAEDVAVPKKVRYRRQREEHRIEKRCWTRIRDTSLSHSYTAATTAAGSPILYTTDIISTRGFC